MKKTCFLIVRAAAVLALAAASQAASGGPTPRGSSPIPSPRRAVKNLVYVIPVDEELLGGMMIDHWMANFVRRKIVEAKRQRAAVIILKIRTNGGMVDAMFKLAEAIDGAKPIPVVAYVDERALSAGAYVALCCDRIYMRTASRMGSATGVTLGFTGIQKASQKVQSDLSAAFRARAEMKPRHKPYTALYEGMVETKVEVLEISYDQGGRKKTEYITRMDYDKDDYAGVKNLRVHTLYDSQTLVNVTANEALGFGMTDGTVVDLDDLVQRLLPTAPGKGPGGSGGTPPQVIQIVPSASDRVAHFLSSWIVSGLLILVGFVGLLMEFKGVGHGLGVTIFAFCLGLFFWCWFVAGSAGGFEIFLFFLGAVLLAVEIFAIPGFGFFGIAGIVALVGSLLLAMLPDGYLTPSISTDLMPLRMQMIGQAMLSVFMAISLSIVVFLVLGRYMRYLPIMGRMVLETTIDSTVHDSEKRIELYDLVGKTGLAATTLRPAGKADIGEKRYSVVSQREFIERGTPVRVLDISGNRIVVERVDES